MMIRTTIERLDFFLVAFIFVGQSFGNEYMMTCSRPVVTKNPRVLKLDLGLPCDLSSQSWCNLPGDKYPWHAVRSFVFENQGLMRRMYGEVRQLSVLRMEFNGNSIDENNSMGREFDELFKPVSPTTSPKTSTSSHPPLVTQFTTTESSSSSSSSTSSSNYNNNNSSFNPTTGESPVSLKSNNVEEEEGPDRSTLGSASIGPSAAQPNLNVINADDGVTGVGNGNTVEPLRFSEDDAQSILMTTTEGQTDGTTMQYRVNSNNDDNDADIFTTESIHHILFQDAERATTTARLRTTTEESMSSSEAPYSSSQPPASSPSTEEDNNSEASDSPQQIHRSDIKGVNACPVKEEVVAPYWANNTRGEVLALLNLYPFEQYIHWEKCTFEHRQMYCREGCRCEQQYRLHRLLAFDPTNECRGIFSDWFRFPSCCVCKCYLTSSDLAQERFSFNRSPRFDDSDVPDVNGVDDSHFYYKSTGFNSRQPR